MPFGVLRVIKKKKKNKCNISQLIFTRQSGLRSPDDSQYSFFPVVAWSSVTQWTTIYHIVINPVGCEPLSRVLRGARYFGVAVLVKLKKGNKFCYTHKVKVPKKNYSVSVYKFKKNYLFNTLKI